MGKPQNRKESFFMYFKENTKSGNGKKKTLWCLGFLDIGVNMLWNQVIIEKAKASENC